MAKTRTLLGLVWLLTACAPGSPEPEPTAPAPCRELRVQDPLFERAAFRRGLPLVQPATLAVGETRALLTALLDDGDGTACSSVLVDPSGQPLGPPIEDLGCGAFNGSLAFGDDFVVPPRSVSEPLIVLRADGRRELRRLGDVPEPCSTCWAGGWQSGDALVILAIVPDRAGGTLFRYLVGPERTTATALEPLRSAGFRGDALASGDARGGVVLWSSESRPGVWVQVVDGEGQPRGPARQEALGRVFKEVRPAVRGELHAFWTSDESGSRGQLVFARTTTTALTVGPTIDLGALPRALVSTPLGYQLLSGAELVELDAGGALVRRLPLPAGDVFGAGKAGLLSARAAQDVDLRPQIFVQGRLAFNAPWRPVPISSVRIAANARGALIAWSEVSVREGDYRRGLGLMRVGPDGEQAPPVSLPGKGQLGWVVASESGFWVGLSGEILRVGFDGETEVLDRVNIVGPPVVLGDRIFSVEGGRGLFEVNAGGAPTFLQDGQNLQLLVPDVTGTRTLLTSVRRTDDGHDLDVRLVASESLLGAPITLRGFAGLTVRSWTCGSGCWELGTPYGTERWRVVLEDDGLRATRLPDAARPIEVAAGDACRSVQVERDGLAYVLASPGAQRPLGLARSVDIARVGQDRFWVVSAERDRGLVVRSLEP